MSRDHYTEDSLQSLNVFRKEIDTLSNVAYELTSLSRNFKAVGNEKMYFLLDSLAEEISMSCDTLEKNQSQELKREYDHTMQQTGRILGTLLDNCTKE